MGLPTLRHRDEPPLHGLSVHDAGARTSDLRAVARPWTRRLRARIDGDVRAPVLFQSCARDDGGMGSAFHPTRTEATLHLVGMVLLLGFLVSFVLAPWTVLPGAFFLAVAVCLGLVYVLGMQRLTGGDWAKDFTFETIGEQAGLWRYIWSPSGIRRSTAVIRGH